MHLALLILVVFSMNNSLAIFTFKTVPKCFLANITFFYIADSYIFEKSIIFLIIKKVFMPLKLT